MTQQSRLGSLAEAATNIVIGYTIAVLSQAVIFPLFGVHLAMKEHMLMGLLFTVVSLVRSYTIRRIYNKYNFFGRNKQ